MERQLLPHRDGAALRRLIQLHPSVRDMFRRLSCLDGDECGWLLDQGFVLDFECRGLYDSACRYAGIDVFRTTFTECKAANMTHIRDGIYLALKYNRHELLQFFAALPGFACKPMPNLPTLLTASIIQTIVERPVLHPLLHLHPLLSSLIPFSHTHPETVTRLWPCAQRLWQLHQSLHGLKTWLSCYRLDADVFWTMALTRDLDWTSTTSAEVLGALGELQCIEHIVCDDSYWSCDRGDDAPTIMADDILCVTTLTAAIRNGHLDLVQLLLSMPEILALDLDDAITLARSRPAIMLMFVDARINIP